jgi:anti-sigma factor RsiW
MNAFAPDDNTLQAYLDEQLDAAMQDQVKRYLDSHPDAARKLEQLQQEQQRLRAELEHSVTTPAPRRLDPWHIRRAVRARQQRHLALAASLLLTLSLGTLGGWQLRDFSMRQVYLPMADATQAYRMFAGNPMAQQVDLKSNQANQLQNWLNQHFVQAALLPDFSAYGFSPVGGRLMASDKGAAAMVLYQNQQGQAIVYYMRPPGELLNFGTGNRKEGNLLTQYWRQGRYFYAVVSATDSPATAPVQRAIEPGRPQS